MRKSVPGAAIALLGLALPGCGGASSETESQAHVALDASADDGETMSNKTRQQSAGEKMLDEERAMIDAVNSGGMPGCFDAKLSGRQRAVAERLGGQPCESENASAAPSSSQSGDGWAGRYEGQFDGGSGSLVISPPTSIGYHQVQAEVAGGGCSGQATVSAQPRGNRMVLEIPVENNQGLCRITLNRNGSSIAVSESGCAELHGMSCGFSGSVARQGGGAAKTAPVNKTPDAKSATWIVGAWAPRNEGCENGTLIAYVRNGGFATNEARGRWQLSGDVLTKTTLQIAELGETSMTPLAEPWTERSRVTSVSANRDAFTLRRQDGSVVSMIRCL